MRHVAGSTMRIASDASSSNARKRRSAAFRRSRSTTVAKSWAMTPMPITYATRKCGQVLANFSSPGRPSIA